MHAAQSVRFALPFYGSKFRRTACQAMLEGSPKWDQVLARRPYQFDMISANACKSRWFSSGFFTATRYQPPPSPL